MGPDARVAKHPLNIMTAIDLVDCTSAREPNRCRFALRPLVDEVVKAVGAQLVAQGISTDIDVPSQLAIVADRELMRRALFNLVLNALAAMPDGGELTIIGFLDPQGLVLEVADSGPGLSEEAGHGVFPSPLPSETSGRGLALAIVHRIAEVHGGQVTAANCAQRGAAFTIRIPQRRKEAAA